MKLHIGFFTVSIISGLVIGWQPAYAQENTQDNSGNRLPEEIVIIGQKQLSLLNRQIIEAEEIMYGFFNEFNDDDRFDIQCIVKPMRGSRIKEHICLPGYLNEALSQQGQAFISEVRGATGQQSINLMGVYTQNQPILKQKMMDIAEQHPEFFDAVEKTEILKQELENLKSANAGGSE